MDALKAEIALLRQRNEKLQKKSDTLQKRCDQLEKASSNSDATHNHTAEFWVEGIQNVQTIR